ncbi:MAG: hypothetical protein ACRC91_03460 [Aeromonas sp.]
MLRRTFWFCSLLLLLSGTLAGSARAGEQDRQEIVIGTTVGDFADMGGIGVTMRATAACR